jgi:hypothetical protein
MTKPVFQRDNMHNANGTVFKDMEGYIRLKIPAASNLAKSRLVMTQPTHKLPLTQLHDKLRSVVYVSLIPKHFFA